MKKEFYLQIPEPCHENWNVMTPAEHGRFCDSCAKQVMDFTSMSGKEILNVLTKASGSTCGRFTNEQLEKPLIQEVPSSLKPYKFFLSAFIPAFLFAGKAISQHTIKGDTVMYQAPVSPQRMMGQIALVSSTIKGSVTQANGEPAVNAMVSLKETKGFVLADKYGRFSIDFPDDKNKVVVQVVANTYQPYEVAVLKNQVKPLFIKLLKEEVIVIGGRVRLRENRPTPVAVSSTIEGRVADEFGAPLAYASVRENSTNTNTISDSAGKFYLRIASSIQPAELTTTYVGYEPVITSLKGDKKDSVTIIMRSPAKLGEVVVTSYPNIECALVGTLGGVSLVRKVTVADTINRYVAKVFRNEMFKVFPNPAARASNIHISFKEQGTYTLQLLDNSGKLYSTKELKVEPKQISSIELPSNIGVGQYYIKAINSKTRKQFVDKIIVQ